MLAINPALVALELAAAGNVTPVDALMADLRTRGVRSVSSSGVLGDPARASAEEGRWLLEAAAEDLVRSVMDWTGRRR
jgi:creatinine amidohydrolase